MTIRSPILCARSNYCSLAKPTPSHFYIPPSFLILFEASISCHVITTLRNRSRASMEELDCISGFEGVSLLGTAFLDLNTPPLVQCLFPEVWEVSDTQSVISSSLQAPSRHGFLFPNVFKVEHLLFISCRVVHFNRKLNSSLALIRMTIRSSVPALFVKYVDSSARVHHL